MKEKKCVDCGKLLSSGKHQSGLCRQCASWRVYENARQMKVKKGPYYEKWKAGVKAAADRL